MAAKIGKTVGESQPYWPAAPKRPRKARPTSWSCCSTMSASPISAATARRSRRRPSTPSPARGLRYTGFHTTAMCSTTRAALLTGRNHHSVGVGCLANFDSGYPGYRGKIAREAGTLAEMLRPHGYRNYMLGKWHVTPLTEIGRHRPVRRLAARPRLRPLLRLHGRRDRPVRARAGARQHAGRSAGQLRHRLSPDRRPGRPGDPLSSPITSADDAEIAVADLAGASAPATRRTRRRAT